MQPGDSVQPDNSSSEPTWQYKADNQAAPNSAPTPSPAPAPAETPQGAPANTPSPQALPPEPSTSASDGISWTASEFIAHQKSFGWYFILLLIAVGLSGAVYLLTRDVISTGAVIVFAFLFAVVAARKPRELQYTVDDKGIQIGEKTYPYNAFRSFALVQEDGVASIWLMPLKRFMPIISIYFDPKEGDRIADLLSRDLPVEDHQPELFDRLMHRIRF